MQRPAPDFPARGPRAFALSLLLALLGSCRGGVAEGDPRPGSIEPRIVDYHVHILGDRLLADWKTLGATFSRPDSVYRSYEGWLGPEEAEVQSPILHGALLVPMAHIYGSEEFRMGLGLSIEEELAAVQAENDHVAEEAARHPGSAWALASVDLLRPYALEELQRASRLAKIVGFKVHLGSAGFDPREEEHLAALERVIAFADHEGLWLLLHLDPQRRGLQAIDMQRLLERVLGPYPEARVVIAHLGGSGGFGPWTRSVLATCTDWLAAEAALGRERRGIYFDLSAVPMLHESEGVPATTEEELALLAPALRRLGLQRLLFGSDFPVFDPREHAAYLLRSSGLSREELALILARRLPLQRLPR